MVANMYFQVVQCKILFYNFSVARPFSDHSSLDSLLDPAYPEDDLARQSGAEGLSLTNLSHDSGLTTSDSQLYAFEEPETNNNNNSFSSDDFCIETITSNENKVHAIVNKKFLSRYQNAYHRQEEEGMEADEEKRLFGSGGQDSANNGNSPAKRKLNQKRQTHKDRMQRRIQRHSAYDAGNGPGQFVSPASRPEAMESLAGYDYDVRTTKMSFPLRRTASEESVQQKQQPHGNSIDFIQHIFHSSAGNHNTNNNSRRRRPVVHRKGRAPNPPRGGGGTSKTSPSIIRSNSVNQVVRHHHWGSADQPTATDWYRSKSTTRLNSEDSEESCSTLSDEDSTPHVSRSNSYGRSEDNSFASLTATGPADEEMSAYDDTTYDIYLHDERILNMATDLDDAFVNNSRRSKSAREFDSFSCETPPGYEESIYRQRLLRLGNAPATAATSYLASPVRATLNAKSPSSPQILLGQQQQQQQQQQALLPDRVIIEKQVELSAKAKAVFEQSLKKYNDNLKEGTTPPPLPPKTDRPPLPPKQRSRRSTEHESSDDQTYVNSADLRASRGAVASNNTPGNNNRTRLSIGGGASHAQNNGSAMGNHYHRHSSSDERESTEFVYGSYLSGKGSTTRVSVPAPQYSPPTLPPKEASRLPSAGEHHTADRKLSSPAVAVAPGTKKQITSTKIVTTARVMKSVETQTDENDFYSLFPDERPDDDESFFNSNTTDSEYSPDSNRSLSPEYPLSSGSGAGGNMTGSGAPALFYRPSPSGADRKSDFYLTSSPTPSSVAALMTATLFERPVSAQSVGGGLRTAGRRKLEPVASAPGRHHVDPVMAGEINWSVSQLRSLFNQGLAAQSRTDSAASNYESSTATGGGGGGGQELFNGGRLPGSHLQDHHHRRLYQNDHNVGHQGSGQNGGVLHFSSHGRGAKSNSYSNYAPTTANNGLVFGSHNYSSVYSGDNQHSDSDQESYV
jgi:hypothetical protein